MSESAEEIPMEEPKASHEAVEQMNSEASVANDIPSNKSSATVLEEREQVETEPAKEGEKKTEPVSKNEPDASKKVVEEQIDRFHEHEAFDLLLKKYVSTSGAVNYAGLKKRTQQIERLCGAIGIERT